MTKLPVIGALSDSQSRIISYLRVSVTDRCNYRCTYCVPDGGVSMVSRKELLEFEEIARIVELFAQMGVRRVRLTGGEPTIRKDLVLLVGRLAIIPGIEELAMTSNAHLMETMAEPLARAGLKSLNVSLDTLDPGPFAQLTVKGNLARVLRGIDASLAAGLRLSLNTVALKGQNDRQFAAICRYAWERGITPRFIEHMPMSEGMVFDPAHQLSAAQIREQLSRAFDAPLIPADAGDHRGPARYWRLAGSENRFGIISAMSEHFCDTCNRVRLSATGQLHTCLAYDDATDLRAMLRQGRSNEEMALAIQAALLGKRDGHVFDGNGGGSPRKHMISIGG